MSARSLSTRVAAAAVGAILLAVVTFGLVTQALTTHELRLRLDGALRRGATDVGRLAASAPSVLTAPGALDAPANGRSLLIEVVDRRGRIVARSLSLGARLLPLDAGAKAVARTGHPRFSDVLLGSTKLRRYTAPIAEAGGPAAGGIVMVASERSDIEETSRRLRVLLLLGGLAAAALAGGLAAALTRRGLAPLRRLSDGAALIEQTGDPTRRLPASAATDEVASLTATLNRMLDALESSREAERRFLADASHELRTPVTALVGNVDYAERHGIEPELLADLRHDATRLARLVDQLLVLEREVSAPPVDKRVHLDELVREATAGLPRVELGELAPAVALGDPDALARAVVNLVENATLHGPPDGPVRVSVGVADDRAHISVSDSGPGPAPADRDRLFERFWRGRTANGRPGSGLGLSIVASIVARHRGTVSVDGSTFVVELPLVDV